MISDELKKHIEQLFQKKEYDELIKVTDKFIKLNERPPGLASLIGTCKILKKNRSKEDVLSALGYFEEAYLKGNLLFRDWEDWYKNYRLTNSPK